MAEKNNQNIKDTIEFLEKSEELKPKIKDEKVNADLTKIVNLFNDMSILLEKIDKDDSNISDISSDSDKTKKKAKKNLVF